MDDKLASASPPSVRSIDISTQERFWNVISDFSKKDVIFAVESYSDADFYGKLLTHYRENGHISYCFQIWAPISNSNQEFGSVNYLQAFFSLGFLYIPNGKPQPTGRAAALNFVYVVRKKGFRDCFAIVDRDLIDPSCVSRSPKWESGEFEADNETLQLWVEQNPDVCFRTQCADLETSIISGNPAMMKRFARDLKTEFKCENELHSTVEAALSTALANSCLAGKFRFAQSRTCAAGKQKGLLGVCQSFFLLLRRDDSVVSSFLSTSQSFVSFWDLLAEMKGQLQECSALDETCSIFVEQFRRLFPSSETSASEACWDDGRAGWAHEVAIDCVSDCQVENYWRFCNGHTLLRLFVSYLGVLPGKDIQITSRLSKRFWENTNSWESASLGKTFRWVYDAAGKIESSLTK